MTSQGKNRGWTIVWNNYSDSELQHLRAKFSEPRVRYAILALERGESGTAHIQAYVYFHNTTTFNGLKKGLSKCHIEVARTGPEYNRYYCMKGEQSHDEWNEFKNEGPNWGLNAVYEEFGEFPEYSDAKKRCEKSREKRKADWDAYYEAAKEGRMDDIPKGIYIKHMRQFDELAKRFRPKKAWLETRSNNAWIWGPTHTGKSWTVRSQCESLYVKDVNKWWDDYQDEDVVLIEDWDINDGHTARRLKLWADVYPFRGETKGGHMSEIRPVQVNVTSNYPLDMCFKDGDLEALKDRFQEIYRGINYVTGEETTEDEYRRKLSSRLNEKSSSQGTGNPVPRYDPYEVLREESLIYRDYGI